MSKEVDALRDVLSAEFGDEVLQFNKTWRGKDGREHSMSFDYIEDETVMDRLEDALGLGAASFDFDVITDTAVRGTMTIRWPDGSTSRYQDFGYATRADSAEPYKEAVSDAIRRLGRYVGVARYLYRKHESQASGGRAAPPSARPPARPSVVRDDVPEEPPEMFAPIGGKSAPAEIPTDNCPIHDVPWNGEPGDLWHKGPDGYCRHPENVRKARRA